MKQCRDVTYHYTLPVGSIRIEQLKYGTIWKRLKRWFRNQEEINRKMVDRQIAEEAEGSLVETMKGLER